MLFKNLYLFKGSSSIKSYKIDKHITLLILLGMIFVLIFTLLGLAFVEFEYDDFSSGEGVTITRITGFFSYKTLLSSFQLGVFTLILLFEYLRGHIGEKRFSDRGNEISFPFYVYVVFLTTALFVPSFVFIAAER